MKKCLKISVVTPTFNRAAFLEDTIASVTKQSYSNLEYIVIDAGSTDKSLEIINKYSNFISYWVSEPDNGMYHAIQKGFDKSSGDIMAWLNSDDKYKEGTFRIVNQIFSTLPDVEWIIGLPSYYTEEGLCVKVEQQRRWAYSRFLLGDYRWIQQESVFWRRSLWNKAGGYFDTSLKFAADFELWCRFFQHSKLHSVVTPLSGFRLHGNQLSLEQASNYEMEVKRIAGTLQRPKSARFLLLQLIWVLRTGMLNTHIKFFVFLSQILTKVADRFQDYPNLIYYDFSLGEWTHD